MPFNKIAELGMEMGKAQLILESKDQQIKQLQEENEKVRENNRQLLQRLQIKSTDAAQ